MQVFRSAIADIRGLHAALAPARRRLEERSHGILAAQIAVTEIPAPTGAESTRASWMAARMRALALADVHIDDAGNVVGTREGTTAESAVVVCAHLDTVFDTSEIRVRRDGARVCAPGIGDNGRGLAALLALAEAIDGSAVRTVRPVRFVATTGEEGIGDLRGAKHHFASAPAHAAIALDGTGDERIVHRGVGSRRFCVTFAGPGGHSWADFGIANPLHAAARAIARLADLALPTEPRTTLTVSRAGGGLSVNSIPQRAWFEVDVRSVSAEPIARLEAELHAIVRAAAIEANTTNPSHVPSLTSQVVVIGARPCGTLPPNEPLVEAAIQATRLTGRTPELAHASTDANVPLSMGIPAIAIGGGGLGGEVHTTSEWYEDADGVRGVGRALTIVVAAAS